MDRVFDALVTAAAADVARHRFAYLVVGGFWVFHQQCGGLHDLADLAIAALRDISLAPGKCPAMRLLPGRPDHAGRRTADGKSKTHTRPDTRSDVGQYLPLRHLPTHRKRGQSRFHGGLIMNIITNPNKLRGIESRIRIKVEN